MKWSGIKNGRLLALLEQEKFDVFITGDRNLEFQQNVPATRVAVTVLAARSTLLRDTLPLMPRVVALLSTVRPGMVTVISDPESPGN
ncbi:MAG: hypothetical protein ABI680_08160 [Chthoniobacteraceae bacterium]